MGGKHKKNLRAAKAKVKLKKKKTLPKGQNITDTTFKVKKIITVEQLKQVDENEPVTSWNVPMKNLLIQVNIHGKAAKLNRLNGMKEIIIKHPAILKGPFLPLIISKILDLMSDIEVKVRAAAASLLKIVFSKLDKSQIIPFHDLLNIHLGCKMTHRQAAVQKDSLKLADIIIEFAPQAIKQNFKLIMTNLIRILSTSLYLSHSEACLTRGTVKDMEENQIAILERLKKIISIYYPEVKLEEVKCTTVTASNSNNFSFRAVTNPRERVAHLPEIFKPRAAEDQTTLGNEEGDLRLVTSKVVDLLFKAWTEFSPASNGNGPRREFSLSENGAKLLKVILEILILLHDKFSRMGTQEAKDFSCTCATNFGRLFLLNFPYFPQITNKVQVGRDGDFEKGYSRQNLMVCYLAYGLRLNMSSETEERLNDYVLNSLLAHNVKDEEVLCKILEVVVLGRSKRKIAETFLDAAVKACISTNNLEYRHKLMDILAQVVADDRYSHFHSSSSLKNLYVHLTKRLWGKEISSRDLIALTKGVTREVGREAFRAVEHKFGDIVANLPRIRVEGCDDDEGRRQIANILYWCDVGVVDRALKSDVLEKCELSTDLKSYLANIFSYRIAR